jgi:uncharacterized membrane protein YraQ (UPF0718 family)
VSWFHFNLQDFSISFLSILFEGVPFMFIGTLIAGIIDAFVPAERMEHLLPRNTAAAIAVSAVLGTIFPMCECGVVPVIRRMIRKGLPVSCGITYLLAAPIINPIVALSTFAAFRGQHPGMVMSLRLTLGFIVACVVGTVVQRLPLATVLNSKMLAALPAHRRQRVALAKTSELALALATEHSVAAGMVFPVVSSETIVESRELAHSGPTFGAKISGAIRCAAFDFLDVGFYLVIGAAIASVFNTAVNKDVILPLAAHNPVAVSGMMILAFLLSLCSTSDAFIAANFITFPLASKLAFMVFGPMMDVKLLFMYGLVFRRRFTLGIAAGLFVLIGLLCLGLSLFHL